jgi:two-component system, LuxR family, sensor kinase FixL
VLNLVHNAADALTDITNRKRELIVQTRRAGDNKIIMTIEDCGCGLADADVTKLFQPFYSTKQDNMGMGLSICQTIAVSHGGRISASSRSPYGAIFRVDLPAASAP